MPPEFQTLNWSQICKVQDESHELWSGGKSLEERLSALETLLNWPVATLEYVGLVEGEAVCASAKLYNCQITVEGIALPTLGIGAVFTPASRRGAGHATRLMAAIESRARSKGAKALMLWSDIGTDFYRRLGYLAYAATAVSVEPQLNGYGDAQVRESNGEIEFKHKLFSSLVKVLQIGTYRDKGLWSFWRTLNHSKDYLIGEGNHPLGYFTGSLQPGYLWVDEALAVKGSEGELWSAISRFARQHDLAQIRAWQQPFHVLPAPKEEKPLLRAIPMIKILGGNPPRTYLSSNQMFFGSIDHF